MAFIHIMIIFFFSEYIRNLVFNFHTFLTQQNNIVLIIIEKNLSKFKTGNFRKQIKYSKYFQNLIVNRK